MATISKTSTFEVPKFSQSFFPLRSVGFCLRAWPRAAAPEATHRCTRQPGRAPIRSSSGSSRPRRPWMRRPTTAVASDEGFGEKTLLRQWDRCEEVDEMLIRFRVPVFGGYCFHIFWNGCRQNNLHQDFVVFFVITICISLSTSSCFSFCGPTLGSDFAPEFGESTTLLDSTNVTSAFLQVS